MAQLCFHERAGEGSDSLKMECLPQLCSAAIHTLKNASVSHVNSRSLAVCIQDFCLEEKMTAIFRGLWETGPAFGSTYVILHWN